MPKPLFIVKERFVYGTRTNSYGLLNSCKFISNKLSSEGIDSKTVQVVDNNRIDYEVSTFNPTHCFIEALWVVPSKFQELASLHPNVKWIVRLHSMIPFISTEGMAFEWLNEYETLKKSGIDISISANNKKLFDDLKNIYTGVSYTPNMYYDLGEKSYESFSFEEPGAINVGCFGALRPLKNTVKQALLAMKFSDSIGKKLKFHVNVSEHEHVQAGPIIKNLRNLFASSTHVLVEHPWYEHKDFLNVVKSMDLGMQISFSETFNITAADFVHCGVPIVVSNEIDFVHSSCKSDVHDDNKIMQAITNAFYNQVLGGRTLSIDQKITEMNKNLLSQHNAAAIKSWKKYLFA
jgi:hypothetical protein